MRDAEIVRAHTEKRYNPYKRAIQARKNITWRQKLQQMRALLPLTQNERDARQNNIRFEMKDHCLNGALELPTCERQRSLLKSVPSVATKWKFFPPTLTCNAANADLLSLTTLIRAPDGVYIPKSAGNLTSQEKLKKRREDAPWPLQTTTCGSS